ncbi:hypothetical protein ACGFS9_28080 [Streptomyces sp. NPDC048566]|uniref:hypothetical protein n=1 Tax=Streptomyces sp. NPDC048566 TaxID=3365569 RepID=UPI003712C084
MQTLRIKASTSGTAKGARHPPGGDLLPALAGGATTVGAVGAYLALADADTPLRGPLTLFFLLAAPSAAVGAALRGLDPFGRVLASASGAVALDMLVAQGMLAAHRWSVPGGVAVVAAVSSLSMLVTAARSRHRRRGPSNGSDKSAGKAE